MNRQSFLHWCAPALLLLGSVLVSAQGQLLPSSPTRGFGGSITPAWDGWFDNPDGTHSFLIGYYSRNSEQEVDVPIGPDNHFDPPGDADRGQPTHFYPRRHYGVFTVTVPKDFPKTQKVSWTLKANGVTTTIPFHMHTDYNISPWKGSEESPDGTYNAPAVLRFQATGGPSFNGPTGTIAKAVSKTATVNTPMALEMWTDDDARGTNGGGGGGRGGERSPVTLLIEKYRGPGKIKVTPTRVAVETLKGGKFLEPFSGKASPTVTFDTAGDYVLQVTANDFSGSGGGGAACCWTTAMVKVTVK